ncbi:uncharacterized protein PHALS_07002 [Plasmopara halstedii]|uniref:Uncharacterized protein n=1 Tax=Plasmopara halstedii TaxID=4781 RepID=A0A0P1B5A4_PLAHL|nr:uncharacterized protein PHALS_07002 [Plasmopara halstedii]CEG49230.1 hypothetical protein PHALS_07002 [Plasmopara halstedii]|eukprot:XP_024585599.1 hypothetical protein PHALS_07002 [Plasmopara halstedii]
MGAQGVLHGPVQIGDWLHLFCCATKFRAKPCNDRVPPGTSPHEAAYTISSNALSYNIALVDIEAHANDKRVKFGCQS